MPSVAGATTAEFAAGVATTVGVATGPSSHSVSVGTASGWLVLAAGAVIIFVSVALVSTAVVTY